MDQFASSIAYVNQQMWARPRPEKRNWNAYPKVHPFLEMGVHVKNAAFGVDPNLNKAAAEVLSLFDFIGIEPMLLVPARIAPRGNKCESRRSTWFLDGNARSKTNSVDAFHFCQSCVAVLNRCMESHACIGSRKSVHPVGRLDSCCGRRQLERATETIEYGW